MTDTSTDLAVTAGIESRLKRSTVRLTAAQALIRFLGAQHSERDGRMQPLIPGIFGIFGHGNAAGLGQALAAGEGGVRYLQGKNEQAMVHAAIGFAKANHRMATLGVTTSIGPGATNLVTGAATATINRLPVLLLPGDVFARRRQGPVLQQLEHGQSRDVSVNDCLRPVSRYFDRITRPEQLIDSLPQAVRALLDQANTGAVTLALCQDVQGEAFDFPTELFAPRVHPVLRQPPSQEAITHAAEIVLQAERPFLICGGGVRYAQAAEHLRDFTNEFGVPVGETPAGRGTARACDLVCGGMGFVGSQAANTLARDADVVLTVGTRMLDTVTGSHSLFQTPDVRFVSINVHAGDAAKMGSLAILGDAALTLTALGDALRAAGWRAPAAWRQRTAAAVSEWNETVSVALDRPSNQLRGADVVWELGEFTSDEDRVVLASSTAAAYAQAFWARDAAKCDIEYGYSCMGHELPAAVGAAIAGKDRAVYALIGDGTYLMGHASELVTAIQERLKIVLIVLVNNGFQCIRAFEEKAMGREFGTQFRLRDAATGNYTGPVVGVDYAANAASFGCATFTAETRAELRTALEATRQIDRPCVIAARVSSEDFDLPSAAWWDYGSAEAVDDPSTMTQHHGYLAAAAKQRWYL